MKIGSFAYKNKTIGKLLRLNNGMGNINSHFIQSGFQEIHKENKHEALLIQLQRSEAQMNESPEVVNKSPTERVSFLGNMHEEIIFTEGIRTGKKHASKQVFKSGNKTNDQRPNSGFRKNPK